jgi:hypothetical protein
MICQWFGLKITGTICQWFVLKIAGMISPDLTSKPVVEDWRVFRFGLKTGSYDLVICDSKSP